MYGKIPPQAIELEKAVLGVLMMEKEKLQEVLEIITEAECFYVDAHQRIYNCILNIISKGGAVDLLTITEELRKCDELELIGGAYYLTQLTMGVVSSAHTEAHARIVMEKYMMRRIISSCGQAMADAYEDKEDVFVIMDSLEKSMYELSHQNAGNDLTDINLEVVEVLQDIDEKRQKQITFTGIPTGFPDLDKLTGGWQPSDLIILAARPSVGKTAFAINLAVNAATSSFKKSAVAFFSLEMGKDQIAKRYLSLVTNTKLEDIRNPTKLMPEDVTRMTEVSSSVQSAPIFIDDTAAISVSQLKGKARRYLKKIEKRRKGEGLLIIIDYLQLMSSGKYYKGNREQEISSISRDLKELGKELNVPILALSQLSREVEKRGDKKPMLADLRESGAIEQDADLIMFLYRPTEEDIKSIPRLEHAIYLDTQKHRNGKLDAMPVYKDLSIQKFSSEVLSPSFDAFNPSFGKPQNFKPLNEVAEEIKSKTKIEEPDDLPF